MQSWSADAIILSVKQHGESGAVIGVLTQDHGVFNGYVRGGNSRRQRGALQVGNQVAAQWRARVSGQLGTLTLEPIRERAALVMHEVARLAGLTAATSITALCVPERQSCPALYQALEALLDIICMSEADEMTWGVALARYELGLLEELGFGLDFSRCAATGETEDLLYVSPKSGRAVSRLAGEPYKDRLFTLPQFLKEGGRGSSTMGDIIQALNLTGSFLMTHVLEPKNEELPEARRRLVAQFTRNLSA